MFKKTILEPLAISSQLHGFLTYSKSIEQENNNNETETH